jgi:hypothetical protein
MQPALSPTIFQTVAVDDWHSRNPDLVQWQSTYLEPSLVVRAPGGWRKVLVSWEVPAEEGYGFEFACAIIPWAWSGWVEGQGALVEVWVSSSPDIAPPRRVWRRWLNLARPEDRRWHRAAVDLVVSSKPESGGNSGGRLSPTFLAADAASPGVTSASSSRKGIAERARFQTSRAREIFSRGGHGTPNALLEEEDIRVFQEAVSRYPDLANAHAALSEVATSLGYYPLALAESRDAARLDPEEHHYWMRLGQELQRAGRRADAIEAMAVALEKAPGNSNYHGARVRASERARRTGESEDRLLKRYVLDAKTLGPGRLASVERQAGDSEGSPGRPSAR